MRELPSSWTVITLGEAGSWRGGGTPSKEVSEFWVNGDVPWVSPKDMKAEVIRDSQDHITDRAIEQSAANRVPEGSVLVVTRSGILAHTLPVAVTEVEVTVNQDLKALTPNDGIEANFVAWALRAFAYHILETCKKDGTTVASIEFEGLRRYQVPLAPQNEQRRIVEAIDSYLTRLDAAVASLKRVQVKLKAYRASVLKAAVEGRLVPTEASLARAEKRAYEPASALLRSRDALVPPRKRRAGRLWGAGVVPELNDIERSKLPDGWCWAKVRDLGPSPGEVVQVGPMSMRSQDFSDEGVKVLNVGCVQWGHIDEAKANKLPKEEAEKFDRYRVQPGDVLFTRSGTVGRSAVTGQQQSGSLITFHLLRVRPSPDRCVPEYLQIVFQGASHVRRQTREASIGTTRAGFNTMLLAMLDVPLPPLPEQHRIVVEVETLLSEVEEGEATVSRAIRRCARLRQAVLKWAFEGKLVDQDRNDESAETLLARIRADRAAVSPAKKTFGRRAGGAA